MRRTWTQLRQGVRRVRGTRASLAVVQALRIAPPCPESSRTRRGSVVLVHAVERVHDPVVVRLVDRRVVVLSCLPGLGRRLLRGYGARSGRSRPPSPTRCSAAAAATPVLAVRPAMTTT